MGRTYGGFQLLHVHTAVVSLGKALLSICPQCLRPLALNEYEWFLSVKRFEQLERGKVLFKLKPFTWSKANIFSQSISVKFISPHPALLKMLMQNKRLLFRDLNTN